MPRCDYYGADCEIDHYYRRLERESTHWQVMNEIAWNQPGNGDDDGLMGHSQGRDNVKKRAARRKKTERLALTKKSAAKKTGK